MYVIFSAILLVAFVAALVDIIRIPDSNIKNLSKLPWVFIVILLPFIGTVLWFAVGREYSTPVSQGGFGDPRRWQQPAEAPRRDAAPLSIEQEMAALDREIEYHENEARIRRLEEQLRARRDTDGDK